MVGRAIPDVGGVGFVLFLGRLVPVLADRDERRCMGIETVVGACSAIMAPRPNASAEIEPPVLLAVLVQSRLEAKSVGFARAVEDPKVQGSEPSRSGGESHCIQ